jgi:dipeptidyl aminopeptidase/acylaminoacyl peptidase
MRFEGIGTKIVLVLVVIVLGLTPGCLGNFKLTTGLWGWNTSISGGYQGDAGQDWVNELVFLAFVIIPVYQIAALADVIIFNTIEYWSGESVLDGSMVFEDGDTKLELTRSDDGREIDVRVSNDEGIVSESRLVASPNGVIRRFDANGELLATAYMQPNGALLVRDADGEESQITQAQVDELLGR